LTGALAAKAVTFGVWNVDGVTGVASVEVASFGPQATKAGANQLGAIAGHGAVIPPRPFMVIQDEDLPAIDEVFLNWISERAATAGLQAV
jgi:phage gpG-like protein